MVGKKENEGLNGETRLNDIIKAYFLGVLACETLLIINERASKCNQMYKKPFPRYATILSRNSRSLFALPAFKTEYNRTMLCYHCTNTDITTITTNIEDVSKEKGGKKTRIFARERNVLNVSQTRHPLAKDSLNSLLLSGLLNNRPLTKL